MTGPRHHLPGIGGDPSHILAAATERESRTRRSDQIIKGGVWDLRGTGCILGLRAQPLRQLRGVVKLYGSCATDHNRVGNDGADTRLSRRHVA